MININDEIAKIKNALFFSNTGIDNLSKDFIIFVNSVEKVFIEPEYEHFYGCYENIKWLPTSPAQPDPFYSKRAMPKDLVDIRLMITKSITLSIRSMINKPFLCDSHDFTIAARNAICYAFRQYLYESYFTLGDSWKK